MRESSVELYLVNQTRNFGGEERKLKWVGRNGAPDRLILMPGGRCWFVEVKATGEKPRPEQDREHSRLRALGFTVYVVDSYKAVDDMFKEEGFGI